MAACAIMQRFGRPSIPTDQAWIESLFGYVKGEWRAWNASATPLNSALELDHVRQEYNTVGCTPGSATSTPTTSTTAAATPSARPAGRAHPARHTDWHAVEPAERPQP